MKRIASMLTGLIPRTARVSAGAIEYEYEYRDAEYEYEEIPSGWGIMGVMAPKSS